MLRSICPGASYSNSCQAAPFEPRHTTQLSHPRPPRAPAPTHRRSSLGTRRQAMAPASTKYLSAVSSMPLVVRMTLAPAGGGGAGSKRVGRRGAGLQVGLQGVPGNLAAGHQGLGGPTAAPAYEQHRSCRHARRPTAAAPTRVDDFLDALPRDVQLPLPDLLQLLGVADQHLWERGEAARRRSWTPSYGQSRAAQPGCEPTAHNAQHVATAFCGVPTGTAATGQDLALPGWPPSRRSVASCLPTTLVFAKLSPHHSRPAPARQSACAPSAGSCPGTRCAPPSRSWACPGGRRAGGSMRAGRSALGSHCWLECTLQAKLRRHGALFNHGSSVCNKAPSQQCHGQPNQTLSSRSQPSRPAPHLRRAAHVEGVPVQQLRLLGALAVRLEDVDGAHRVPHAAARGGGRGAGVQRV